MINLESSTSAQSWKGKIACQYVDRNLRLDTNQVKTSVNSYIYALFEKGEATIKFGKHEITVHEGSYLIFPPHIPPVLVSMSDDYYALCLIVSSSFVYDCPMARNVYQSATFSLVNEDNPVMHITNEERENFRTIFKVIMGHITHSHNYTTESLQSLYGLLLSDTMSVIEQNAQSSYLNHRSYELFIEFNKLLRQYFCEHHDITFYADSLCITPRYLSMIVKNISHMTVANYINRHLMLEACWLLKTTNLSIQQISMKLHFSDQASFSKFFKRLRGENPLQYRRDKSRQSIE